MSNRFEKEMVEAVEEMAAHMRGEIESESYEVDSSPKEAPSEGRHSPKTLVPCKSVKKPDKAQTIKGDMNDENVDGCGFSFRNDGH